MKKNEETMRLLEQQILSQNIQHIQQQIESIQEQLMELDRLHQDLQSLKNQDSSKTFSSLGGGIFVESEIKKSDSVLLSVGYNVVVKKSKEEAIKLIDMQKKQLKEIQEKMESELNNINLNLLSAK